ncbi:MAG: hypothetical protein JSW31_18910 [Burkholderiales bacterium]|nr:MAG: hypothetical protein JSW31_18910 [Burkholderiales bacterium]
MDALNVQRAVLLACWPATDRLLAGIGTDAALIDVAGKPLVQRVVEQAVALGARQIDVVLGDNATAYQTCLGDGERWGCHIDYHYAPAGACLPRPLARRLADVDDCLLLLADAMLPAGYRPPPASFGGSTVEGDLTWAGWARLPGAALVAAAAPVTSPRTLFLALCRDRQLRRCRDVAGPSAGSAAALLDAATALLRAPDYPIGIARRPAADGLWIGNGARVHPSARLTAPVWLGAHVLVAADAVIGPDAVIGARSIVDRRATIAGSLVAPDSYVGAGVELRGAILSGRSLVNVALEARLDIADRELAGPVVAVDDATRPAPAERLLAGLLWAASWPLAKSAGAGAGATRQDGSAETVAAVQCGVPGAWVRHFCLVLHPGLLDVVRGRRRIVGPLPPLAGMGSGLLNDSLYLGPDGADPALRLAADTLAAGRQTIVRNLGAILRYARAVAVDWRSQNAPGTQAAPALVRNSSDR